MGFTGCDIFVMVKDGSLVGFKKSRTVLLCSLPHTRMIVGSLSGKYFVTLRSWGGHMEMSMTSLVEKNCEQPQMFTLLNVVLYKLLTVHAIIHGLMFRNELSNE